MPFAFAIAALATGRLGAEWMRAIAALGAGRLGDPGHRAICWAPGGRTTCWAGAATGAGTRSRTSALMPWLVGTAFIHSVMMQERRGMLKVWNMALVHGRRSTWRIFGTFVVRSGVICVGPLVRAVRDRAVLPGVPGAGHRRLARRCSSTACRSCAAENQFDALRLARGQLPAEQPAVRRHRLRDLLGHDLPAGLGSGRRARRSTRRRRRSSSRSPARCCSALMLLMGVGPLLPWRRASLRAIVRRDPPPLVAAIVADRGSCFVSTSASHRRPSAFPRRLRHGGGRWPRFARRAPARRLGNGEIRTPGHLCAGCGATGGAGRATFVHLGVGDQSPRRARLAVLPDRASGRAQ